MDQQITNLIASQVDAVLNSSNFASYPPEQKEELRVKIEDYLNNVILDTTVDNLTDDQVLELQDLDPNSPEMEQKLEQYSALIPNFLDILNQKIAQEVANLQNNPTLLQNPQTN